MNQGTQGYSLTKKTRGRKSRETVPLKWKQSGGEKLPSLRMKTSIQLFEIISLRKLSVN
jgi:hypothetical protein